MVRELDEVRSTDVSEQRDDRAAMAALGLDPDDFGSPDAADVAGEDAEAVPPAPVLAVVGRPNVGKSTLVNRLLGRREAVVQDIPGVTRDRVAYDALWNGRRFTLVDTGGWEPDATGLQAAVAAQAELAMRTADAVLLVVDAQRRRHRHRRGGGPGAAPLGPAGAARRHQGRRRPADRPTPPRCGGSGWASRTRSAACTGAARATCWTRSWTALPETPRDDFGAAPAARAGSRWSASRTSASPACSTACPASCARWCTTSPAPPSTRSTRWSSWTARSGGSSTPRACASGCRPPAAWSTTPACAPAPRSRPPRWPSC